MTKEANRKAHKQRLREIVNEAKSVYCADCKTYYPYYVMDFDHPENNKTATVNKLVSNMVSVGRLVKEIEKCEVVCANCHRQRTWRRLHPGEY